MLTQLASNIDERTLLAEQIALILSNKMPASEL